MNALIGVGFAAGIVYGLLVDGTYFKIYFSILAVYTVIFNYIAIDRTLLTKRKNINVTSWSGKCLFIIKYSSGRSFCIPRS
jgi:hypothetical protein